jgi:hypothetical protein
VRSLSLRIAEGGDEFAAEVGDVGDDAAHAFHAELL